MKPAAPVTRTAFPSRITFLSSILFPFFQLTRITYTLTGWGHRPYPLARSCPSLLGRDSHLLGSLRPFSPQDDVARFALDDVHASRIFRT